VLCGGGVVWTVQFIAGIGIGSDAARAHGAVRDEGAAGSGGSVVRSV